MRAHISLPQDLVEAVDKIAGKRQRSAFIEEAIRARLMNARQREMLERLKTLPPLDQSNHPEWSTPELTSAWVHDQRVEADRHSLGKTSRRD